jgi:hypothetical protein
MKKKNIIIFLFLLFSLAACTSNDRRQVGKAENDIDAARDFIRATMDGNYRKARTFMLADSQNTQYLDVYERNYNERMKPEDKEGYKEASINVHEIKNINDSTSVIYYSNSYFKKDTQQLKVVKLNNQWLVDFKYYFQAKNDSLP